MTASIPPGGDTSELSDDWFIIDDGDYYRAPIISDVYTQIVRVYLGGMGRLPDSLGFLWWLVEIETGRYDFKKLANDFVYSTEFNNLADINADGQVNNHEFVTHMYEGVFGREPDQGGYNYWMGELNSGASDQGDVLLNMTQSDEYIDQTFEVVNDYLFF